METFSALLAICAGNSTASGEFPAQRPMTRSFDVFFDLCLNKWLTKQSWGWWFETPSRPLWVIVMMHTFYVCFVFLVLADIGRNHVAAILQTTDFGKTHFLGRFLKTFASNHDDVIKWKHFPRYWPFVRGIHRSRWIPHTKASDAELWCLLWSASE